MEKLQCICRKNVLRDLCRPSFHFSVCPSTTRWTAHDRACLTLCEGYQPFLQALTTSFNDRKEDEALGFLIKLPPKK